MYRSSYQLNQTIWVDDANHETDRVRFLRDSEQDHDRYLVAPPPTGEDKGIGCQMIIPKDVPFVDLLDDPPTSGTVNDEAKECGKDSYYVDLCDQGDDQVVDLLDAANHKCASPKTKKKKDDDRSRFIFGKNEFVKVRRQCLRIRFFRVGAMLRSLIRRLQRKGPYDLSLLERVNRVRKRKKLQLYEQAALLDEMARTQAEKMARDGRLFSCTSSTVNLKLRIGSVYVGENFMRGPSENDIFDAIMFGEAKHRENFLADQFTQMGTGSCLGSDGKLYMCHIFASQSSGYF